MSQRVICVSMCKIGLELCKCEFNAILFYYFLSYVSILCDYFVDGKDIWKLYYISIIELNMLGKSEEMLFVFV